MKTISFAALFLALITSYVPPASAAYSASTRASIRAMPITQRPDRPGHFYGNTVRALHRMSRR